MPNRFCRYPPSCPWTRYLATLCVLILIPTCLWLHPNLPSRHVHAGEQAQEARKGMVVSVSAPASEIGRDILDRGGNAEWKTGDVLTLPDLARTLDLIAANGPDGFYKGEVADRIVAEMTQGGGLITHEDLAGYEAKIRKPVHGTYRGYDVYAPPPP